jgi:hypothetical protein
MEHIVASVTKSYLKRIFLSYLHFQSDRLQIEITVFQAINLYHKIIFWQDYLPDSLIPCGPAQKLFSRIFCTQS